MTPLYSAECLAHFDDADLAGILFFGNYPKIFHREFEKALGEISISWQDWFQHKYYGVPLRHIEIDFKSPIFVGKSFMCHIYCTKVGSSSVQFETHFKKEMDSILCAKIQTIHVFIDKQSLKPVPIPEHIQTQLNAHLTCED